MECKIDWNSDGKYDKTDEIYITQRWSLPSIYEISYHARCVENSLGTKFGVLKGSNWATSMVLKTVGTF